MVVHSLEILYAYPRVVELVSLSDLDHLAIWINTGFSRCKIWPMAGNAHLECSRTLFWSTIWFVNWNHEEEYEKERITFFFHFHCFVTVIEVITLMIDQSINHWFRP